MAKKKQESAEAVVKTAEAPTTNDSIKKAAKPVKWFIQEAAAKRKEKK
jgi:hypothetical protein